MGDPVGQFAGRPHRFELSGVARWRGERVLWELCSRVCSWQESLSAPTAPTPHKGGTRPLRFLSNRQPSSLKQYERFHPDLLFDQQKSAKRAARLISPLMVKAISS